MGSLSRVNHDPPSRPELFETEPYRFAHSALNSIPSGALTQSPGRCETDPGPLVSARVQTESCEERSGDPETLIVHLPELPGP